MTRYFVGTPIEWIRHRRIHPNTVWLTRVDHIRGSAIPPDHIVWGDTADHLPNIADLRAAAGPVVQNVTPTVVATSPDDLMSNTTAPPSEWTKAALIEYAQEHDLDHTGNKAELIERIETYLSGVAQSFLDALGNAIDEESDASP